MKLILGFAFFPFLLASNVIRPNLVPNAFVSDLITFFTSNFLPFLITPTVVDNNKNVPEDFLLTDALIKQNGYGYELHKVITEDGYVLSLHRILPPHGRNINGIPVLLQHGVLASSDQWLVGPNSSLPLLLVDRGYDVWLGDQRGRAYSKGHTTYSVKDPAYWNFTFHESGVYDLPAFIDCKDSSEKRYIYEFLPQSGELIKVVRNNCVPDSPVLNFCLDFIGLGYGEQNKFGLSRFYDHGKQKNLEVYGSDAPPFYPLERITAPIALYYGDNDTLMNKRSAAELASRLPNLIVNKMVADPKFTHTDFMFGLNAKEMLYEDVINMMNAIQQK